MFYLEAAQCAVNMIDHVLHKCFQANINKRRRFLTVGFGPATAHPASSRSIIPPSSCILSPRNHMCNRPTAITLPLFLGIYDINVWYWCTHHSGLPISSNTNVILTFMRHWWDHVLDNRQRSIKLLRAKRCSSFHPQMTQPTGWYLWLIHAMSVSVIVLICKSTQSFSLLVSSVMQIMQRVLCM